MNHFLIAAESSVGSQMLASLIVAVPASVLTVVVSWMAILRTRVERRVEAQIAAEFQREQGRFEDRLQRRRDLVMRVLEKEMLEPLEQIMASAYRGRNAVRDLAALPPSADERADIAKQLAGEGRAFQAAIMENRIKLNALSAFHEAHELKNSLLAVVRAVQTDRHEDLATGAVLVESSFQRFDHALNEVLAPDAEEGS